ncbi:hypothetical protein METY_0247 [Methylopila sp. Yamaguchi]|nr:hypothetical protein METY_0247 [Methylopila sp. Yamaguchi]
MQTKFDYGAAFYIHAPVGSMTRELWAGLAYEIGILVPESLKVPAHTAANVMDRMDVLQIAADAIAQRKMTQLFITAWARLHALYERYCMLSLTGEAGGVTIKQALAGMTKSVEVQKHWYAHWIRANAPSLTPEFRGIAVESLRSLCVDIRRERLAPWGPYPKDWFARLIPDVKDSSGRVASGEDIGDNFIKLGEGAIKKMLRHPLLTPAVLPPLSRTEFEQTRRPRGVAGLR